MTKETPRPKRKRWRWIIAGVLLFVVAVTGWLYWPRSDTRFVGSWAIVNEQREIGDLIKFYSNGRCEQSLKGVPFAGLRVWWTDENGIVLDRYPTDPSIIVRSFPMLARKFVDRKGFIRLKVSKLSAEEFTFELTDIAGKSLEIPAQTARRVVE